MKPSFKCQKKSKRFFKGCGALFVTLLVGAIFLNVGSILTGQEVSNHHRDRRHNRFHHDRRDRRRVHRMRERSISGSSQN